MGNNVKWDKKYIFWGITAFLVIAAAVLFYFIVRDFSLILTFFNKLGSILTPFIWGLVVAYIIHPLMSKLESKVPKWAAVLICIVIVLLVLAALVALIIPQVYQSILTIVGNYSNYYNNINNWLDKVLAGNPGIQPIIDNYVGSLDDALKNLVETRVLPSMENIIGEITTGVYSAVKGIINLLIGIIVATYVLANLKAISAGGKKLLYSIFSVDATEKIIKGLAFVDRTFMNFFTGKLLDSLVIGVLCYIFCLVAQMPYGLLVSVIVGVTNIIPFFGPFIGAIPSALLILLVSPFQCLVFVIFIIILQQVDGNIIGPKILSSSTGLNGFWVMFAIIVGGGLFGFAGMILGVPVFVCIYTAIKELINRKLVRSELPTDRNAYLKLDHIDSETGKPIYREEPEKDLIKKIRSDVKTEMKKKKPVKDETNNKKM